MSNPSTLKQRLFAFCIDLGLSLLTSPLLSWLAEISIKTGNTVAWAFGTFIIQITTITMLVYWGASPGKFVMGLSVVDKNGNYLTWYKSFLRCLIPVFIGLIMFLEFHLALQSAISLNHSTVELSYKILRKSFDQQLEWVMYGLVVVFWLSALTILFNIKRRALHDYWSGSFVVQRRRN